MEVRMLTSLKSPMVLIALTAAATLVGTARAADVRVNGRGGSAPQAQPVSRQDQFFGQTQARQDAFFAQPVFPHQPFNQQQQGILPPAFYQPITIQYMGAPTGIYSYTSSTLGPGLQPGIQSGLTTTPAVFNSNSINGTSAFPVTAVYPTQQPINGNYNRQTFSQSMPRMGMLGRW
jgi:hypothetical protein